MSCLEDDIFHVLTFFLACSTMKRTIFSNKQIVTFEVRSEKYSDHIKYLYLKFSTRNFSGGDSFTKTLMFKIHERAMILHFEYFEIRVRICPSFAPQLSPGPQVLRWFHFWVPHSMLPPF